MMVSSQEDRSARAAHWTVGFSHTRKELDRTKPGRPPGVKECFPRTDELPGAVLLVVEIPITVLSIDRSPESPTQVCQRAANADTSENVSAKMPVVKLDESRCDGLVIEHLRRQQPQFESPLVH